MDCHMQRLSFHATVVLYKVLSIRLQPVGQKCYGLRCVPNVQLYKLCVQYGLCGESVVSSETKTSVHTSFQASTFGLLAQIILPLLLLRYR
jgi:hypothetical protein